MLDYLPFFASVALAAVTCLTWLMLARRRRNARNNRRLLRAYYDDTLRCSICASQARLLKCGILLEHEATRPHECNTAELTAQEQADGC